MPTPPATVAEFKDRFDRDFGFGADDDMGAVRDKDVTNALNDATMVFNEGLWADQLELKTAFLFASAHFLVLNIQGAGGLSATNMGRGVLSHGGGVIQSKGVGNVNVNFQLPAFVSDSPILSQFMRTDYGQKYLQLLLPRLVGHTYVLDGWDDTKEPTGE